MNPSPPLRIDLIRTLMEEHTVILRALTLLKLVADDTKKRKPPALADLRTLIRFFKQYADRIHHFSEEEILFVTLQRTRDHSIRRMMDKLCTQHVIGRMLVAQMEDALAGAKLARRGWRTQLVDNATAYHTLLTIHICDEDHVFFPAVDRLLTRRGRARADLVAQSVPTKHSLELSIARLDKKYGMRRQTASNCQDEAYGHACGHKGLN